MILCSRHLILNTKVAVTFMALHFTVCSFLYFTNRLPFRLALFVLMLHNSDIKSTKLCFYHVNIILILKVIVTYKTIMLYVLS